MARNQIMGMTLVEDVGMFSTDEAQLGGSSPTNLAAMSEAEPKEFTDHKFFVDYLYKNELTLAATSFNNGIQGEVQDKSGMTVGAWDDESMTGFVCDSHEAYMKYCNSFESGEFECTAPPGAFNFSGKKEWTKTVGKLNATITEVTKSVSHAHNSNGELIGTYSLKSESGWIKSHKAINGHTPLVSQQVLKLKVGERFNDPEYKGTKYKIVKTATVTENVGHQELLVRIIQLDRMQEEATDYHQGDVIDYLSGIKYEQIGFSLSGMATNEYQPVAGSVGNIGRLIEAYGDKTEGGPGSKPLSKGWCIVSRHDRVLDGPFDSEEEAQELLNNDYSQMDIRVLAPRIEYGSTTQSGAGPTDKTKRFVPVEQETTHTQGPKKTETLIIRQQVDDGEFDAHMPAGATPFIGTPSEFVAKAKQLGFSTQRVSDGIEAYDKGEQLVGLYFEEDGWFLTPKETTHTQGPTGDPSNTTSNTAVSESETCFYVTGTSSGNWKDAVTGSSVTPRTFVSQIKLLDGQWKTLPPVEGTVPEDWHMTWQSMLTPEEIIADISRDYKDIYDIDGPLDTATAPKTEDGIIPTNSNNPGDMPPDPIASQGFIYAIGPDGKVLGGPFKDNASAQAAHPGCSPQTKTADGQMKTEARGTFRKLSSWNDFEVATLSLGSDDFIETQIDGKLVMYALSPGGTDCIAMYYNRAKVGSINADFKGDFISYCEQDPTWPYESVKTEGIVEGKTTKYAVYKHRTLVGETNSYAKAKKLYEEYNLYKGLIITTEHPEYAPDKSFALIKDPKTGEEIGETEVCDNEISAATAAMDFIDARELMVPTDTTSSMEPMPMDTPIDAPLDDPSDPLNPDVSLPSPAEPPGPPSNSINPDTEPSFADSDDSTFNHI